MNKKKLLLVAAQAKYVFYALDAKNVRKPRARGKSKRAANLSWIRSRYIPKLLLVGWWNSFRDPSPNTLLMLIF